MVDLARSDRAPASFPRVTALLAAVGIAAGSAAVTVAVLAGPGPGVTAYVSEAGIAGSPYAWVYRLGVWALAAALLLLGAALPRSTRPAAALLAAGATSTVLSGAVTCSDGCPLPPFETPTIADLVHGAASIAAVAFVAFAMLAVLRTRSVGSALRGPAAVGAAVAFPLAALVALGLLTVGRGSLVGLLERLLLADAALWGLVTALALTRRPETG